MELHAYLLLDDDAKLDAMDKIAEDINIASMHCRMAASRGEFIEYAELDKVVQTLNDRMALMLTNF